MAAKKAWAAPPGFTESAEKERYVLCFPTVHRGSLLALLGGWVGGSHERACARSRERVDGKEIGGVGGWGLSCVVVCVVTFVFFSW